jgi:C1A family cysteine protease
MRIYHLIIFFISASQVTFGVNCMIGTSNVYFRKFVYGIMLVSMLLSQSVGYVGSSVVRAQEGVTETPVALPEPIETPQPLEQPTDLPTQTATPLVEPTAEMTVAPTETIPPVQTIIPTESPQMDLPGFSWELSLDNPESSDTLDNKSGILESLGVTYWSESLGNGTSRLVLQGGGNFDIIRQVIYEILLPTFNFLNGPGTISIQFPTTSGSLVSVSLESQPGTGFTWGLNSPETSTFAIKGIPKTTNRFEGPGTTALQTLVLQPTVTGHSTLELIYQRPFDTTSTVTRHLTIKLPVSVSMIDLSDPNPPDMTTSESVVNELTSQGDIFASGIDSSSLPASFDWRTSGNVSGIRNQGSCGSCWAFGTTAIMESALSINTQTSVDLSEQFLVSCNVASKNTFCGGKYSCAGGCEDAQDYHISDLGQGQTSIGAVLESQFPYSGTDAACPANLTHPYKASSWNFVGDTYYPTVAQIKSAIYSYGPVTSRVCVEGDFYSYRSGVYSTDHTDCLNHLIALVGWDDSTQTWLLRNSWGTGWGESGYMHIRWGVSNVGTLASYITMSSTPPNLISPNGDLTSGQPTYRWNAVNGAGGYQLKVTNNYTGGVVLDWAVPTTACTGGVCTVTPDVLLAVGEYQFTVAVAGQSTFSKSNTFTVATLPCWSLTVPSNNNTFGTVAVAPAPNCLGTKYSDGTQVTLTATHKTNYGFWQWTGGITDNPYVFIIDSNKVLQAQFVALAAPVLTSPSSGILTTVNTPDFAWNAVTYGSTYEIQVDNLSSFAAPIEQTANGLGLAYTASPALTDGLKYWRVRMLNVHAEPGPWSSARSFTVDTNPPLAPILSSPANGGSVRGTPTFSWLSSASATSYQFVYDNDADCLSPLYTSVFQSGLTHKPPTMAVGGPYYWCVKARDPAGNWSYWSASRSITILPMIPVAPVLTSPVSGLLTTDSTPDFTWNAVPYGDTYEIQIDNLSSFAAPIEQTAIGLSLGYTATTLTDGVKYWRVRAINVNHEAGAWSSARTITIDTTPPLPPVLSLPANGVTVRGTPTFSWTASATATAYQFAYDNDADCSSPLYISVFQSALTIKPPLMAVGGPYYWCIKSRDAAGNVSNWSSSRTITILPVIPVAPVLTSPAANIVTNDSTPDFAWNSVPYGVTYEIQIDHLSTFTAPVEQTANGLGLSFTASPPLTLSGLKYWRVRAVNVNLEAGAWSAARAITIKALPPSVPSLVSPASNALMTDYTPTLDWSVVTLASGTSFGFYQVEVATDAGFVNFVTGTTITGLAGHAWDVIPDLLPRATYYWHVKACNDHAECSAWTTARTLRTAIAPPTLLAPATGTHSITYRPTFDWDDPAGATGYTLLISRNPGFTSLVGTYTLPVSTYTPTFNLPAQTLYWKVRANGPYGPGGWSDVWNVIIP